MKSGSPVLEMVMLKEKHAQSVGVTGNGILAVLWQAPCALLFGGWLLSTLPTYIQSLDSSDLFYFILNFIIFIYLFTYLSAVFNNIVPRAEITVDFAQVLAKQEKLCVYSYPAQEVLGFF